MKRARASAHEPRNRRTHIGGTIGQCAAPLAPAPLSAEPIGDGTVVLQTEGYTVRFDWGKPHLLGTAAYWVCQTRTRALAADFQLGSTLAEEVAACLLGGYGLPASVGLAAYSRLRSEGLLAQAPPPRASVIEKALTRPLVVAGFERPVRYRFPRQRSERLARALAVLSRSEPPAKPLALRSWLTTLPGIGPKTASWIVRNRTGSDDVAIIDIHIARVPESFSREGERQAEDLAEMMLPPRYRDLYRADRLRKTGTTRPLIPSDLSDSFVVRDYLEALTDLTGEKENEWEVMTWTL